MKVADLFGAGVPVCALDYGACLAERVRHADNGLLFSTARQLADILFDLFEALSSRSVDARSPAGRRAQVGASDLGRRVEARGEGRCCIEQPLARRGRLAASAVDRNSAILTPWTCDSSKSFRRLPRPDRSPRSGRKLHVSQSAISRQILLLEEELGEPLFLRVGRQVRMTPAAESLVQLGQRVFQDVRDTVGAITDHTRALRGTLRLAGGMTVCLYVFPPLLKHLKRVHPQLDIRLTVATAGRSVEEIRAGRVDAGLLTLPVEESDLVTVPVAARRAAARDDAVASAGAKKRKIVPEDLSGQPFVLFEPGSATRDVIDSFFVTEKIEPTVVMDTENVEIIKAMVKTGPRHQHRAVSGHRARGAGAAVLLRADRRARAGARNRVGLRAREPRAADDQRAADGVRRNPRTAAARADARRAQLGIGESRESDRVHRTRRPSARHAAHVIDRRGVRRSP